MRPLMRPLMRFPIRSPRRLLQLGFLLLTLVGVFVVRGNAERWCPFGGVETIYSYLHEGNTLCSVGVTNLLVIAAVLLSVLLLRRVFCSHACPIGTISEWLHLVGCRLGVGGSRVPRPLDALLSLLKYAVLGVVLWFTWRMGEMVFRGYCPAYALLGRHGEDITFWAYVVSGSILLVSFFVSLPFCRWFCPLAAVMNPLSRLGIVRVVRDGEACLDCGDCTRACPMDIPVHEVNEVTHARCTTCLSCVDACPTHEEGTLALRIPGRVRRVLPRGALAGVFLLLLGGAVLAALLFPLPSFRWSRGEIAPAEGAVLEMHVEGLSCRGRATLLVYFLERDDDLALSGPLRLEAWPGPDGGEARFTYDPERTTADAIRDAVVEPYFDEHMSMWRLSPFGVEGYDPLGAPLEEE